VCDRKYRNVPHESNEYDVVGEIVNRKASHVPICDTRNERTGFGKTLEMAKCLPNFSGESVGYVAAPFSVPCRCLA
jgi:hypothetical protein